MYCCCTLGMHMFWWIFCCKYWWVMNTRSFLWHKCALVYDLGWGYLIRACTINGVKLRAIFIKTSCRGEHFSGMYLFTDFYGIANQRHCAIPHSTNHPCKHLNKRYSTFIQSHDHFEPHWDQCTPDMLRNLFCTLVLMHLHSPRDSTIVNSTWLRILCAWWLGNSIRSFSCSTNLQIRI